MEVDDRSRGPSSSGSLPSSRYLTGGDLTDAEKVALDKYDLEAQESLFEERLKSAYHSKDQDEERRIFEDFLQVFPTAGWIWNRYVTRELERRQFEYVDKLFDRCLISSVNVDLWRTYLRYVIESTTQSKLGPIERKEKIRECYEFALGHIGLDMGSNLIWENYISFMKIEGFDPTVIIDLYYRALGTPMHGLEAVWKDFEAFAEKAIRAQNSNEISARYTTAKRVYEERIRHTEGFSKNQLARPPRNSVTDLHQAKLWKQLIDYEKSNPQDLENDKLAQRVTFTYNQALVVLYHYPEIWHQSALYQLQIGNDEAAKTVYKNAVEVLPNCFLLHFQYCDFLELHNQKNEADAWYKKLIAENQNNMLVWIQYMYFCRRVYGIQGSRKVFFKARNQANCSFHLYVAAAQLEYYVNKDENVARNIFELGYHKFESNVAFLRHYVDFLFHRNEDSHMRVLFEKILANLPPHQSLELWNLFLQYENVCGNLEPVYKLQNRRSKAYPGMDPSCVLASVQRYRFLDLWPCSNPELLSFENDFELDQTENDEDDEADEKAENQTEQKSQIMVKPDVKQMQLYKGTGAPGQVATSSTLSIRLDELMMKLPSARDWSGPMVNIENLMQSIMNFIDMPVVHGPSRLAMNKADDEEETEVQIRSKESAVNDQFRKRLVKTLHK